MKINKVHNLIKAYSDLMRRYYDRGGEQVSFDRGYWHTPGDLEMQDLEEQFLSMGENWEELFLLWKNTSSVEKRTSVLYLMGWSAHYEKTIPIFIQGMKDSSTEISNISARSLFPIIISKKYHLDIEYIIALMHRRSKYHKNKALGFLLYWPYVLELKELSEKELIYIKKLSKHNAPMYAPIAQSILDRIQ